MNVTIEIDGLENALRQAQRVGIAADRVLMAALDAAAKVIEEEIQSGAPGPHIEREPADGVTAVDIGPNREHWYYQFSETGAAPHEIWPKSKAALFFNERFAARVDHPGFAARPFMRPVADAPPAAAGQKAAAVLTDAVEDVAQ